MEMGITINDMVNFMELMQLVKNGNAPKRIRIISYNGVFGTNILNILSDDIIFNCQEREPEIVNKYFDLGGNSWLIKYPISINTVFEILDDNFQEVDKVDFQTVRSQKEKNRLIKDTINQLIENQEKIIERLDKDER